MNTASVGKSRRKIWIFAAVLFAISIVMFMLRWELSGSVLFVLAVLSYVYGRLIHLAEKDWASKDSAVPPKEPQ